MDYKTLYKESITNKEEFWKKQAERIVWDKEPTQILDSSNPPFYRWFKGGKLNVCYNLVDRHVEDGFREQIKKKDDCIVLNIEDEIKKGNFSSVFSEVVKKKSAGEKQEPNEVEKKDYALDLANKIFGMAGMGKTILATMLGHDTDLRKEFKDGIYYLRLDQKPNLEKKTSRSFIRFTKLQ